MHVSVFVYACVNISVCIFMCCLSVFYIHVLIFRSVYACVCLSLCMCVLIFLSLYMPVPDWCFCVCMCLYAFFQSVCICETYCLYAHVYVCVCRCLSWYLPVSLISKAQKSPKIDCLSFVYVPATSAAHNRVLFCFFFFLLRPFTVLMKKTRAVKQSIIL